jgi:hypothetical protein
MDDKFHKRTQTKPPKFYSIQTTPNEKVDLATTMKKKLQK